MTGLRGNYICKAKGWRLRLDEVKDGELSCCFNLELNTLADEGIHFVTLDGSGLYYNTKLFNIGLVAGTNLGNKPITVTSGWSGYQVLNKEKSLQLNLEGIITCLAEGKVIEHTYLKDCLFEKIGNQVSVAIFLDTDYIVENSGKGGSSNSPLPVKNPSKCIYMVADYEHEISGHGYAELNIRAERGDDVIWRAAALDSGSGMYTPHLYQFVETSGGGNMENIKVDFVTTTYAIPETDHDNATKCDPILTQSQIGQVSARVLSGNKVTYHIRFMLVEPTGPGENDFEVVGYYYWAPYINWGT
ncbi:MAG: AidA/PixA family protein [Ignavibacteria bacterium]|jgi:hypothetical protein